MGFSHILSFVFNTVFGNPQKDVYCLNPGTRQYVKMYMEKDVEMATGLT